MVKVQVGIADCSKQVEKGVEKAVSRAKHLENQAESGACEERGVGEGVREVVCDEM